MIYKVYIKKHQFHLPRDMEDLKNKIKENFNLKEIATANFGKTFGVTLIEENESLIVEKQKTNIFLLNQLLLLMEKKEILFSESEVVYLSENEIKQRIGSILKKDVSLLTIDDIEKEVDYFLSSTSEPEVEQIDSNESSKEPVEPEETPQSDSPLEQVEYSLSWLKKANKALKGE